MRDLYSYNDPLEYLKDFIGEKKKKCKSYSHRFIIARLGLSSSSILSQILNGHTKMSDIFLDRLMRFLGLSPEETHYFRILVEFKQAKTESKKKFYSDQLQNFAESKPDIVSSSQFHIYKKWYYNAVRLVLTYYNFKGDYKELGELVYPPITEKEACESIELLLKLGLIVYNEKGILKPANAAISSGNFQRRHT
ncbi:MAG: TIGR02147 family protein [Chitinivibrionales bacterium]|nr:TIGR02147 family protein [Chitinivibrionales bacterium]